MLLPDDAVHALGPEEFAALYRQHHATVLAFARVRTRDAARAEDVAAQTFARAYQAFGRYEERGVPVAAWLLRIAANVIAGDARRGRGVTVLPLTAQHLNVLDGAGAAGPDEWVQRRERAAWLHDHLAALPAEQRRLLWLRFWEDRAIGDVAARIGRSEGATKQLLHRTVKTLRTRMGVME